jgi:mRNA-degrading endonuclease toxin of MazEF toxin-antitoxin module
MCEVSLEAFWVYVVRPLSRSKGGLSGKTRPYLLLRAEKACTSEGGYLMVPLSRQKPRGTFHVEVIHGGEVSYALLDSPKLVSRNRIVEARGPVDDVSEWRVRRAWERLLS